MPTSSKAAAKPPKPKDSPAATIDRLAAAIDALRAGRGVTLLDRSPKTVFAAETMRPTTLKKLEKPHLVLSHARAQTLKIRLYTPEIVALPIPKSMGVEAIRAIADPTADLDYPLKGPFTALRAKLSQAYPAAVKLTKLAGMLPAAVVVLSLIHI